MDSVIIIGKGAGWQDAPLQGQTWGVNELFNRRPVSVTFQLHSGRDHTTFKNEAEAEGSTVIDCDDFPLEEIIEKYKSDYFTNSIAYMIAFAMFNDYKKIDIYGVVMESGSEYIKEKGSVEYWIGFARGSGIEVNVHGGTNLLRCPERNLYGFNVEQKEVGNA